MKCPRTIILGGVALGAVVVATAIFTGHAVDQTPPTPTPAATSTQAPLPRGVQPFVADLDGRQYRCLLYFTSGIDCDWDHPLPTTRPTPTPAASRTTR